MNPTAKRIATTSCYAFVDADTGATCDVSVSLFDNVDTIVSVRVHLPTAFNISLDYVEAEMLGHALLAAAKERRGALGR
jgi:hypothetical protein